MTDSAASAEEKLQACFQRASVLCEGRGLMLTRLASANDRCLRLQLIGKRCEWTVDVDCTWPRLTKLPEVRLRAPLGLLAHVGYDGLVCVTDSAGLSFDQERQADVVAQTVLDAFDLLERSAADAAADKIEFFNELEGYWSGLPRLSIGRSAVEVDSRDRIVSSYVDFGGRRQFWYFTERDGIAPPEFQLTHLTKMRAMYVVLDQAVLPPKAGDELVAEFVERIRATFSPGQETLWQQLTSSTSKKQRKLFAMIASVPRVAGGRSLIGMSFYVRDGRIDTRGAATPIAVFRHTTSYMRERGGAIATVAGKHVAIFGCGSVGSEVADALASSGVGQLTLVDPDIMSEENVFRHALGRNRIGVHKVLALREDLLSKYPGVVVEVAKIEAQEWIAKGNVNAMDGIVVALGHPTLERAIARGLRSARKPIPVVLTWLEPLDLGGHSLHFMATGPGCLDCIYRDEDGADALTSQTAFLESGQPVTRNLTGCSSVFVPYGAIQSRRTALLAAEQLLRALGGAAAPAYAFWVGEGAEASKQGLRTTSWWSRAKSTLAADATKQLFARPCRRCRSG